MLRWTLTLLLTCLLARPGLALELQFQLLDWQPGQDPVLKQRIKDHFHLKLDKLPTLQQIPDGLVLTNPGGAPVATAYAPVEMARGTFTLRFEVRSDAPRPCTVRFASNRIDFEATPQWTERAVTVEAQGPMGPSGVAFSLRDALGRMEVRKLTILRMNLRVRVQSLTNVVVNSPGGTLTVLGIQAVPEVPGGAQAEFRLIPCDRWRDPDSPQPDEVAYGPNPALKNPNPIQPGPEGLRWARRVPPNGFYLFREPIEPALLRWRLVDAEGHLLHSGGELRVGPAAPRPSGPVVRDVQVRADGTMLLEGRPWFPMGLYTHKPWPESLKAARQLGLNLLLVRAPDDAPALLEQARREGIQVLLATPIEPDEKKPGERVAALVKQYSKLPVVAWNFVDEPDMRIQFAPMLETLYVSLAGADSRPLYESNHSPSTLGFMGLSADILALDPYPLSSQPSPVATVATWMEQARCVLSPGRSVWYINQAFALAPFWNEPPSPEQLRCMNWLALNHGARGLVYYCLDDILTPGYPDNHWELMKSPLAESIRRQSEELSALQPYFVSGDGPYPVDLDGPVDAAVYRDGKGHAMVSVVNMGDRRVRIGLGLEEVAAARELPDGLVQPLAQGTLTTELAPYQVRLYLLEKTEKAP